MTELELALLGWRLTLAEVTYHMPDARNLLQIFIWQDMDRATKFPRLNRFLDFWERELEGPIHSVRVAVRGIIAPTELKVYNGEFRLN